MDRLQLDKNAKLTGRVYFKDEVMWLGLSGSGASFTFDGTKLVLKLKGDNIAVGDNPIDYARIAVYVDGKRVVDEMINCAEKEVTVIDRTGSAKSVVEIIKLSESPMSAVGIEAFTEGSAEALPENGHANVPTGLFQDHRLYNNCGESLLAGLYPSHGGIPHPVSAENIQSVP